MNSWILRRSPHAIALVVLSPLLALPFFALFELIASQAPSIDAAAQHGRSLQVIGYALFVSLLSLDTMIRAYYLTVPIIGAAALGLLCVRLSRVKGIIFCALGVGLVYVTLFYAGLYFSFLEEPFYT